MDLRRAIARILLQAALVKGREAQRPTPNTKSRTAGERRRSTSPEARPANPQGGREEDEPLTNGEPPVVDGSGGRGD